MLTLASVAAAATDQTVVDEYLVRCLDGTQDGAFVELNATGPGQTFDATIGLRVLGPSGNLIADAPAIFADRAGQPWPQGTRYLLTGAAFEALTGIAPDGLLRALPPTNGGSIVLYRQPASGAAVVLDRVDYSSSSSLHRLPPAGRSAVRTSDGRHLLSSEASPTTSAGVLARAPGCFASAQRPFVIQELATSCASGDPAGGFIEVSTSATNQFLDGDLQLRARDHAGVLLFDVPLGFGSLEGQPLSPGKSWLIGGPSLLSAGGVGPDLAWPAPLDTAGGTVTLHGSDAAGAEVVLFELIYGTPAQPALSPGTSLVWDPFTSTYAVTSPTTPMGFDSNPRSAVACGVPSSVRIQELFTACSLDPQQGSYLQLIAVATGETRDSTLSLAVYDSARQLRGEVPAGFGNRAGSSWPTGSAWLLATAGITNAQRALPDAALPLLLDPVAGRIEVQRRPQGPQGLREVIQIVSWGGTKPAPPTGQALVRVTDFNYRVNGPQPRNSNAALFGCAPPPDTAISVATTSAELCVGCFDGSRRGQFVRLNLSYGTLLDSNFVFRLYDHNQQLVGTLPQLFLRASGLRAPPGASWLLGDPSYGFSGVPTDGTLPTPLDPLGGTLEVVWLRDGVVRVPGRIAYGPLAPGGFSLTQSGTAATRQFPTPYDFSGALRLLPGCHFTSASAPGKPYVAEIFSSCFDGSLGLQYVLIGGLLTSITPDPRLGLDIKGIDGRVSNHFYPLFPDTIPAGDGSPARQLLIAGPDFERLAGLAPDIVLTTPLDTNAGSIDITLRNTLTGVAEIVSETSYEAVRGRAIVMAPDRQTYTRRQPRATRLDGRAAAFPPECGDPTPVVPMQLNQLVLGCFDGDPRGQCLKLVSSGLDDSLTTDYVLVVRDRSGATTGEASPAFGQQVGLPPSGGRSLLYTNIAMPSPITPDVVLPPLDTLAGSIALVQRSATGERAVWSYRYDRSDPALMPMGMAFTPTSDTTWGVRVPTLEDWAGQRGALVGCHRGSSFVTPVVVRGVAGACGDGSLGQSYVELTVSQASPLVEGLHLRVTDLDGGMDIPLFDDLHAFQTWPAGHSLLFASDSFAVLTGITPDRRLPRAIGGTPAIVQIYAREPGSTAERLAAFESFDFAGRPEPGRALQRTAPGVLTSTSSPTPVTWDGRSHTLPPECLTQLGLPDAVRLARVLFGCTNGGTGSQFVQIDRTSGLATRASELRLRLLDHGGQLLGERASLFGLSSLTYWGAASSLTLGGPEFDATFHLASDAPLPAAMDVGGGTIQLVLPGPSGDRVLSELRYGAAGVPLPPAGMALAWTGTAWAVDSLPVPHGLTAIGQPSLVCGANCDVESFQLGLGGAQVSFEQTGAFTGLGSAVRYDLPRGEFSVQSSFRLTQLMMGDLYTLLGAVPGDSLTATVELSEHHADTCLANACLHSTRRLVLLVNGVVVDSLAAGVRGEVTLRRPVPFEPGKTTRVQVLVAAEGRLTPPLDASVSGRLSFAQPRLGTRLVSCHGYDSNRTRVVLDAEVHADAHRVELSWPVYADSGFVADVQRLDEADSLAGWRTLATLPLGDHARIGFVDRTMKADHGYRYRLAWFDRDGAHYSEQTFVQVPRSFGFALLGVRPNPSHGSVAVSFELPEAAETQLELFDIGGRRVREWRARVSAGPQLVQVDGGARVAPGLYTVRLRAAGREARLTAVVLR